MSSIILFLGASRLVQELCPKIRSATRARGAWVSLPKFWGKKPKATTKVTLNEPLIISSISQQYRKPCSEQQPQILFNNVFLCTELFDTTKKTLFVDTHSASCRNHCLDCFCNGYLKKMQQFQ